MIDIRSWSFVRVVAVSAAWIVVTLFAAPLLVLGMSIAGDAPFRSELGAGGPVGSAGIGAVSVGISGLVLLAIFAVIFAPPVILIARWAIGRRRRTS